jgi:hypothetical protein
MRRGSSQALGTTRFISMARYAADLLFKYQVRAAPQARPLCEHRIVVFKAETAPAAIRQAKQMGRAAQFRYRNTDGRTVQVRFVGLVDVLDIDFVGPEEVYYHMRRMADPKRLVRRDSELTVSESGSPQVGSSWWAVPGFLVKGRARARRPVRGRRRRA